MDAYVYTRAHDTFRRSRSVYTYACLVIRLYYIDREKKIANARV